jgi:tetratricopeptide (TPR) repeat protein
MKSARRKARPRTQPTRAQSTGPVKLTGDSLIRFVLPFSIFVLTFVAFLPTLQNGFVNWDDEAVLLDNPHYRGLGWEQLRWMFTTFHMSVYRPIAWITMGFDYLIWGMNPFGYHLSSLLFHCANAVLFYFVALRLLRLAMPTTAATKLSLRMAAGFAALLFALHPLRVEPVAWESGEDNLVAGFFLMLTVLCYLRAVTITESGFYRWCWIGITWIFCALALLSKALTVPLPLALLVLDIYPLKRLSIDPRTWFQPKARQILWEKVPFLLLMVPIAIVAVLAKRSTGAVASAASVTWFPRLMQSFYGLAFYLWKTIVPWDLSPLYERPIPFNPWDWPFLLSGVIVIAVSICLVWLRHRWPAGLAAWVYYAVILLPALGIITYGPQIVGDRYSYFSCLSWALLAGAGLLYLWQAHAAGEIGARTFGLINGLAGILLVSLGVLTWKQTEIWHDSEKLWRHALALDQKSSFAHNNLGLVLAKRGAFEEAINEFRAAIRIDPAFVEAYTNLGNFLAQTGSRQEAIVHLRHALQIEPTFVNAHNTLGNILADTGAVDDAVAHFRKALKANPESAMTHYNLARVLAKRGDFDEAIGQYRTAIEVNPADPDIHNNLGLLLARRGSLDEAIAQFREALRVDPHYAKAYFNLGKVFAQQDRLDDAVQNFQQALRIEPAVAEIHESLGRTLARQGKQKEAIEEYQKALRLLESQSKDGRVR